jgi:uncharacterized lipoprotein YmbA
MRVTTRLMIASLPILAACASAPVIHYYTFDMAPSGRSPAAVALRVRGFQTTEALGRRQILIQTSPTEIEYYATDQWAGDVGELVAQKLAAELGPAAPDAPVLAVTGTVVDCGQVDRPGGGAAARLTLEATVRDPTHPRSQPPLLVKTYTCERPAEQATPTAVARALSRCVEAIAAELVSDAAPAVTATGHTATSG